MSSPEVGKTVLKKIEQHGDRWTSFGASSQILSISDRLTPDELRKFKIFRDYDDKFLDKISSDVSVAIWKKDSILFEEGSYIDMAFFVVEGEVEAFVQGIGEAGAGPPPIFDASRTVMSAPPEQPEQPEDDGTRWQTKPQGQALPGEITLLASMDFDLPKGSVMTLSENDIFGEIGALSGWPQSVTARARTNCQLVQIRINALRLMKRKSKALKKRLKSELPNSEFYRVEIHTDGQPAEDDRTLVVMRYVPALGSQALPVEGAAGG